MLLLFSGMSSRVMSSKRMALSAWVRATLSPLTNFSDILRFGRNRQVLIGARLQVSSRGDQRLRADNFLKIVSIEFPVLSRKSALIVRALFIRTKVANPFTHDEKPV